MTDLSIYQMRRKSEIEIIIHLILFFLDMDTISRFLLPWVTYTRHMQSNAKSATNTEPCLLLN